MAARALMDDCPYRIQCPGRLTGVRPAPTCLDAPRSPTRRRLGTSRCAAIINRMGHAARALLLDQLSAKLSAMASAIMEVLMGDKSPKSKQKDDKQKQAKGKADAEKAQAKQQPKAAKK